MGRKNGIQRTNTGRVPVSKSLTPADFLPVFDEISDEVPGMWTAAELDEKLTPEINISDVGQDLAFPRFLKPYHVAPLCWAYQHARVMFRYKPAELQKVPVQSRSHLAGERPAVVFQRLVLEEVYKRVGIFAERHLRRVAEVDLTEVTCFGPIRDMAGMLQQHRVLVASMMPGSFPVGPVYCPTVCGICPLCVDKIVTQALAGKFDVKEFEAAQKAAVEQKE